MREWKRWRRALYVVAITCLATALAACGQPTAERQAPRLQPQIVQTTPPNVPGKLLYTSANTFWTLEPRTNARRKLTNFPDQTYPDAPAVSPDRARIAYSLTRLGTDANDPAVGTDLYVMNVDGTDQQRVLAHTDPWEWLSEPAWTPDGQTLYFTRRHPNQGQSIQRIRLDESQPVVIAEHGQSPTVSRDGNQIAYVTFDRPNGLFALSVTDPDGANVRQVIPFGEFDALNAPRFSPDGRWLAFGAVGGENVAPSEHADDSQQDPLSWFKPRAAQAHGIPWNVWVIKLDGTGLQQISNQGGPKPTPAWSQDGKWIAFQGEVGLDLVNAEGKLRWNLTREAVGDGLAWVGP